ncbi:hypothetical protein [Paenarthrobacter sp. C1]|uniref:hypothetical protein n=1 Tax=Paenarthrobacter sp. C1 TaxID=3400220 RepID=UPI003BF60BDD
MSLTSLLQDPQSPERAYLDRISPLLEASAGHSAGARAAAEALGLSEVASSRAVVSPFPGADPRLAGTAFDFRARIELGGLDPRHSVAAAGVALLPSIAASVENGGHRTRVLAEAFDVASMLLQEPRNDSNSDRAAIMLAYCEQVARTGATAMNGSLGMLCDQVMDGQSFADKVDPRALANLRSLVASNGDQLEAWQDQIAAGVRYEPNPQFSGSPLVGGADADWMIGDTLIDCKVYSALTIGKLRDFLRQLLGYVMLDTDDSLGIRRVGIWLPRQRLMPTWNLTHLLGGNSEELLPSLRDGFIKATARTQLARPEPVPERRLHQLLADNRHTPFDMLDKLASNEDPDIRGRVGRNESTPEPTVRTLAGDTRWLVRRGVASNRNAPEDVLEALAGDRSVAVRRAAKENPRAPRPLLKAVTTDGRHDGAQITQLSDAENVGARTTSGTRGGAAVEVGSIRINQHRDESSLDTRWFWDFLHLAEGGGRLPIPLASSIWGWKTGRSLTAGEWMRDGLPDYVVADLIRADRPAWVRRAAARELSLSDPDVRTSLLSDADPEVRWLTLERTVWQRGEDLTALLAELGTSRDARLQFRTAGLGARRDWPYTANEYDQQTLRVLAAHPAAPYGTLMALIEGSTPEVLANLAENPALTANDRAGIIRSLQTSKSAAARARLASLVSAPEASLIELASDRDAGVRAAVAAHHATPPSALTRLSGDRQRDVRLAVLSNPACPLELARSIAESLLITDVDEDLLEVLGLIGDRVDVGLPAGVVEEALDRLSKSRKRDPDMRLMVARDERSAEKTLARLARSTDEHVRSEVASNRRTPYTVMEQLAGDPEPGVRAAVAAHEGMPAPLLHRLAEDEDPRVRATAAGNRRLPQSTLAVLLDDPAESVRAAARKNPSAPEELVREAEAELEFSAEQTGPDRAALERMVADRSAKVRESVAFSWAAGADLLTMLGGERRSAQVRRAVAANPNTPVAVLTSLAGDTDAQVRQAVAFNGATPRELLVELAGRSVDLAIHVAMNPGVPRDVLDALAQDSSPLVRFVASGYSQSRGALGSGTAGLALGGGAGLPHT